MRFKKRPTEESIAAVVLGASSQLATDGGHLDENDLALLDINSLSDPERRHIRMHLEVCDECRELVADLLRQRGDSCETNESALESLAERLRAS